MFTTLLRAMLKTLWVIAHNTFRETIRDRILYSLIGFSILVIATSLLAASVSLGQDIRVIQSFGLTALLVFLLLITIFIGTQLVFREVERKTIYLVLSKPVKREVFYLGKFLGLALTIAVATAIMGAVFLALLAYKTKAFSWPALSAIGFMLMEAWLLTAIGMLFGSFTSPIASAIYTFCLAIIGHSSTSILTISQKSQPFLKYTLQGVYYVFPNLEKFNLRNEIIYNLTPQSPQVTAVILYFAAYTAALLLAGMAILKRDEF